MTTTQPRPVNHGEMTAVNLADGYAEEALEALRSTGTTPAGIGYALLALGARLDALRETLSRELPDIGEAIYSALSEETK